MTIKSYWTLATPKEVEEALIKEGLKKYNKGDKFKQDDLGTIGIFEEDSFSYSELDNSLYCNGTTLFYKGVWATKIVEEKKEDKIDNLTDILNDAIDKLNKLR